MWRGDCATYIMVCHNRDLIIERALAIFAIRLRKYA